MANILVSWDEISGAVSYNIYRSIDSGASYQSLATGVLETEYTDTAGTIDYFYKVAGVDQFSVEGDLSEPISGYDPSEVCRVYGSIVNIDGSLADSDEYRVEVTFYVNTNDLPRFAQNNLLTRHDVIAKTDARGIFSVNLVQGALATMHVKDTGLKRRFMVPVASELKLEDIPAISDEIEIYNPF